MKLKQKRTIESFRKAVNSGVTVSSVFSVVDDIIQESRRGTLLPRDGQITPFHTAQDLIDNRELVHDREFLSHMVAMATGRFLNQLSTPDVMELLHTPQITNIINSTNTVESKVIDKILLKYSN